MADDEKRPAKKRSKPKPPRRGGTGGGRGGKGDTPQGPGKHHGGDPVRIHEEYVKRHLEGGADATLEAYERAVDDFEKMPGAVRTPSSLKRTRRPPGPTKPSPNQDANDADKPS